MPRLLADGVGDDHGEQSTGVTLLEMGDDVDAGDILAQTEVPIGNDDDIGTVVDRVTDAYVDMTATIPALLAGALGGAGSHPPPSDDSVPTLRDRLVVAKPTDPRPCESDGAAYAGAHTTLDGERLCLANPSRKESARTSAP